MLGLFAARPGVLVVNMCSAGPGTFQDVLITRPFILQNIYPITEQHNRAQVLELHRKYVIKHLLNRKSPVRKELARLVRLIKEGKRVRLLCHCKPKRCHGDLYVRVLTMRVEGKSWATISNLI